jgi:hypothetical protein
VIIMFAAPSPGGLPPRRRWKIGVDGSVAIIVVGAGGSIDG